MERMLTITAVFLHFVLFVAGTGNANSYRENAKKLALPRFLPTNANFEKNIGDTVVLECAVENLGQKQVSWRKLSENGKILTVGYVIFSGNSRMEVEHPPMSSFWNLIIRDLKREDAGVYECQISSKVKHLRHHVTLLVKDGPEESTDKAEKKSKIQVNGTSFVDEGKSINLTCNATSSEQPPEDLDWFRSGIRLQTSKAEGVYIRKYVSLSTATIVSVLEINHARLEDSGMYVCRTSSLDVDSLMVQVLIGNKKQNKRRGTEADDASRNGGSSPPANQRVLFTPLFLGVLLSCLPSPVT